MEDKSATRALKVIQAWLLKHKGWSLVRGQREVDMIDFLEKTVKNCTRGKVEHQMFGLLHECGHLIAGGKAAILRLVQVPNGVCRTRHHRVSTVLNEVRAWDAGERLAKRLGIKIDSSNYAKYRSKYLVKYFKWAMNSKKKLKIK